jgi:putative protease
MAARRRKVGKSANRRSKRAVRRPKPKPKRKRSTAGRKRTKPAAAVRKQTRRTARASARPRQPKPAATPVRARVAAGAPLVAGALVEVGVVLHYYPRPGAGVVALARPIHRGDTIHVRGQTTDFVQTVEELALDGASVAEGAPPQQVGVRLAQRARAGDRVFRVSW